jgi:hypothetical protein
MTDIQKIKNGIRYDLNGWTYISIKGSPKERGFAYGKLIAKDMKEVRRILDFIIQLMIKLLSNTIITL